MTMYPLHTPNPEEGRTVARGHRNVAWTQEADAILREEWGEGKSTTEIARILTAGGRPTTKNSVISRARRLDMPTHVLWSKATPASISSAAAKGRKPIDLTHPTGCRWIEGDAAAWQTKWCDAPMREGSSYCADHHSRVWVKPEKKAEPQPFFVVRPL